MSCAPDLRQPKPWFRSQLAQGWLLVGVAAVSTFASLASAGRLPATDLPQHALFLQRILEGDTAVYAVVWWAPYTLLFWLAIPLAPWLGPAQSIWTVTALAVALVPVAAAALATSLRRSPALGLFAYLAAFSTVLVWGFASLILSAAMFGFAIAAAVRYCARPSALRGVLLALAMVASYCAHLLGFVVTLVAVWAVVLTWPRRVSLPLLWPAVVGSAIDLCLVGLWALSLRRPWAMGAPADVFGREDHDAWLRLTQLPFAASEFGRVGALLSSWLPLAALFVLALTLSLYQYARLAGRARAARVARAPTLPKRLRALGRRFGFSLAFSLAGVLYFTVPLWLGETYLVYPRFLLFMAVLAPGALLVARHRVTHGVACSAIVPVLFLIGAAGNEARVNASRTQCVDRLAERVRPGEAILGLRFGEPAANYSAPIDLHLAAELALRRRGSIGMDFTDFGAGPVSYQPGYDRIVVPANLVWDARLYRHDQHGREFTAWLLHGRTDFSDWVAQNLGKRQAVEVTSCGPWTLAVDRSTEVATPQHRVFMPHQHAVGSCSLARHPELLAGGDSLLKRVESARRGLP